MAASGHTHNAHTPTIYTLYRPTHSSSPTFLLFAFLRRFDLFDRLPLPRARHLAPAKILRLLCVGEEVRASEEEEAAAAAAAQAAAEARAQAEAEAAAASAANPRREIAARDNAVAVSTAGKLGQGKNVEERTVSVASSGGRHPSPRDGLVAGPEEAWGNGQSVLSGGAAVPISTGTNVGNMCGKDEDWEGLGVWRATEAEEAEASRAHSEYIRYSIEGGGVLVSDAISDAILCAFLCG